MRRSSISLTGFSVFAAAFLLGAGGVAAQDHSADHQAVYDAVLDYVEGVYEVAPDRIRRSVHPSLRKIGYARRDANHPYGETPMTFEQLVDLAARWNRDGQVDPETAPKEITVFDVLDQSATAKLVADWGVDYFHLAKYDGRWMIVNVLWQTPPSAHH